MGWNYIQRMISGSSTDKHALEATIRPNQGSNLDYNEIKNLLRDTIQKETEDYSSTEENNELHIEGENPQTELESCYHRLDEVADIQQQARAGMEDSQAKEVVEISVQSEEWVPDAVYREFRENNSYEITSETHI